MCKGGVEEDVAMAMRRSGAAAASPVALRRSGAVAAAQKSEANTQLKV